ncbi:rhoptry protein ROP10 [Besnoitia besnoiti]|uniref:Rhoptry protein ROP10 n=1 Tax=Besnoitia besnoiti TaxID=94643 RepID=A0A2A9M5C9_BESBE|nr:rhoptry protein ROP10 [Besnoitia besnoiti]PFH33698.1 rhoptry protein ROP10 [Besnoitia besnoiti]
MGQLTGTLPVFLLLGLFGISEKLSHSASGLQLRLHSSALWHDRGYPPVGSDAEEALSSSAWVDLSSGENEDADKQQRGGAAGTSGGNALGAAPASPASTDAQAVNPSSPAEPGESPVNATNDAGDESADLSSDIPTLPENSDAGDESLGDQKDNPSTDDNDTVAVTQASDANAEQVDTDPSDAAQPSPAEAGASSAAPTASSETGESVADGGTLTDAEESVSPAGDDLAPTATGAAAADTSLSESAVTSDANSLQESEEVSGSGQPEGTPLNVNPGDPTSDIGNGNSIGDGVSEMGSATSSDGPQEFQEMESPDAAQDQAADTSPSGTEAAGVPFETSGPEAQPSGGASSTQGAPLALLKHEEDVPVVPSASAGSPRFRQWTSQFLGTGKEQFQLMQRTNVAEAAGKGAKNLRASMEILHNTTSFFSALRAQQHARKAASPQQQDSGSPIPNQLHESGAVPLSEPASPRQQEGAVEDTEPEAGVSASTETPDSSEEAGLENV